MTDDNTTDIPGAADTLEALADGAASQGGPAAWSPPRVRRVEPRSTARTSSRPASPDGEAAGLFRRAGDPRVEPLAAHYRECNLGKHQ